MNKRKDIATDTMEALDTLFLFIFGSSLLVPDIGESFGIEKRFLWVPSLVFCGWVVYIGYFRAKVKFSNFKELSFIERMRGWTYGLTFAITLSINGLGLSGLLNPLMITVIAVVLMMFAIILLLRILFGEQLALFNSSQKNKLFKALEEVGVVSIYFSAATLIVQSAIFSTPSPFSILMSILLFFPLIKVYYSEKKSRVMANDLANSLAKTRFLQRYEYFKRKKHSNHSKCFY